MNKFESKEPAVGSLENPVVDSYLRREEILCQNPEQICPREILERQEIVVVKYWSYDGKIHQGQIVVDSALSGDVAELFELMLQEKFPIESVIPVADERINFSDDKSMALNNSSGFNYRFKTFRQDELSPHGRGRAIDLNPRLNPYINKETVLPPGAAYDPQKPGTLHGDHPVVHFLKSRGWVWGGEFETIKDYHHFEKALEQE